MSLINFNLSRISILPSVSSPVESYSCFLPEEVIFTIFSQMPSLIDKVRFSSTSRHFRTVLVPHVTELLYQTICPTFKGLTHLSDIEKQELALLKSEAFTNFSHYFHFSTHFYRTGHSSRQNTARNFLGDIIHTYIDPDRLPGIPRISFEQFILIMRHKKEELHVIHYYECQNITSLARIREHIDREGRDCVPYSSTDESEYDIFRQLGGNGTTHRFAEGKPYQFTEYSFAFLARDEELMTVLNPQRVTVT